MSAVAPSGSYIAERRSERRESDETLGSSERGFTVTVAVDCGVGDRCTRSSLPCEIVRCAAGCLAPIGHAKKTAVLSLY